VGDLAEERSQQCQNNEKLNQTCVHVCHPLS
jgi:hypothetical protein